MDEYDDPVVLKLHTDREVAVLFMALGMGATLLLEQNRLAGAQAASNLQIRAAKADDKRVAGALSAYGEGGLMSGVGQMSPDAAISHLVETQEIDPDELTEGMI